MITLFQCATLDDWTDVMYTNMLGCDQYAYPMSSGHSSNGRKDGGGGPLGGACSAPFAFGWFAALFFVGFVVLGSLVLLTLFVGTVNISMEEAKASLSSKAQEESILHRVSVRHQVSHLHMDSYLELFRIMDVGKSGTLRRDELQPFLSAINPNFSATDLESVFTLVILRVKLCSAILCPCFSLFSDYQEADLTRVFFYFFIYVDYVYTIWASLQKVDRDGSGEVDRPEFVQLMVFFREAVELGLVRVVSVAHPDHPEYNTETGASNEAAGPMDGAEKPGGGCSPADDRDGGSLDSPSLTVEDVAGSASDDDDDDPFAVTLPPPSRPAPVPPPAAVPADVSRAETEATAQAAALASETAAVAASLTAEAAFAVEVDAEAIAADVAAGVLSAVEAGAIVEDAVRCFGRKSLIP
jgi:hypothetical protein